MSLLRFCWASSMGMQGRGLTAWAERDAKANTRMIRRIGRKDMRTFQCHFSRICSIGSEAQMQLFRLRYAPRGMTTLSRFELLRHHTSAIGRGWMCPGSPSVGLFGALHKPRWPSRVLVSEVSVTERSGFSRWLRTYERLLLQYRIGRVQRLPMSALACWRQPRITPGKGRRILADLSRLNIAGHNGGV